ncbi:unnamed protein product [Paramecium pentaurelia]|uniref:Uncharacterized protein n=1 Tax=Paramecium pentaurelia TaxID=43138 RepID=A0A8S1YG49_9CILI|nr:unnamed protein product [Paramecium pentaurelia]
MLYKEDLWLLILYKGDFIPRDFPSSIVELNGKKKHLICLSIPTKFKESITQKGHCKILDREIVKQSNKPARFPIKQLLIQFTKNQPRSFDQMFAKRVFDHWYSSLNIDSHSNYSLLICPQVVSTF